MPTNMTVYNLLISCPSDVNNYVQTIEKIIGNFNANYGEINNSLIVTKHWGKDSYAESGGTPQELLNGQFVLDSDVALALFWTKFGTPNSSEQGGSRTVWKSKRFKKNMLIREFTLLYTEKMNLGENLQMI